MANAKVSISDVCFIDNEFTGSGVVIVEGSMDDLISSNVTGDIDPNLECSYASIGFSSCVDYDSDTCSASNPAGPSVPNVVPVSSPSAPSPMAAAAPTIDDSTSGCFSIHTKVSLVLLLVSVFVAL